MNSRACFCGCDITVSSSSQFAGNLLGWDMTKEFGEWMRITGLLEVAGDLDRDRSNEEVFIGDGRTIWISLREQVHHGLTQERQERKDTKRWMKFSVKNRGKIEKRMRRDGMGNPLSDVVLEPEEIRAWLLEGRWPVLIEDLKREFQEAALSD